RRAPGEKREAISYRAAALGLAGGTLFLLAFSVMAGMALPWAILFFAIYGIVILVVTRIRAELGPPVHDFHLIGPDHVMIEAFGSRAFAGGDLGVIGLYWWFNRAYRGHPMPHGLEGLKMADWTRNSQREGLAESSWPGDAGR